MVVSSVLGVVPAFAVIVLATGLVALGAARVVRALGIADSLDLVISTAVLTGTQIVVTLLFAGVILRQLNVATVLVSNAALTGAAFYLTRGQRWSLPRPGALLARAGSLARGYPLCATLVVVASLALSWRVVVALTLPPYGFDAVAYHLSTVADWLQLERITPSELNTCCAYYPSDGEVLVAWTGLLGQRQEVLGLVQIPAVAVGALAVAGIARAASLTALAACYAGAIYALTPVVLAQSNTAYVDVTFAAWVFAALYLVLRYLACQGRERWALLAIAGAATGLAVGTKPNGIVFGVALSLPLAVHAYRRRNAGWRKLALAGSLFLVPIVCLGAWWYARAWIVTGNPFYPARVEALGLTLFEGRDYLTAPPPRIARQPTLLQPLVSWLADLDFWNQNTYQQGQRSGGLGPVWSYVGALLVLPFALWAYLRSRTVLAFALLPLALLLLVQPYDWWSRFTIPLAGIGAVAVAWALTAERAPRALRRAFAIAVVVLGVAGAAIVTARVDSALGVTFRSTEVLRMAVRGAPGFGTLYHKPDYVWVERIGRPSRIAIDKSTVRFGSPLAGDRLQHRLYAVPRDGDVEELVRRQRIDYVMTTRGSLLDRAIQDSESPLFRLVPTRGRARVYRIDPRS